MSTANFIIIQDGISTLSEDSNLGPNRVEFEFEVADPDLGLRPVLTFMLNLESITLTLSLNGEPVTSTNIFTFGTRMMSEVINENVLQANTNVLLAEVTGTGSASLSDLVMWYRK